jgi:DNA-binding XRE family transcriptional regulator
MFMNECQGGVIIIRHTKVHNMITIDQIRAGRAMARLTQAQLAARAGISTTAMNNIEHGTDARGSTLRAIQTALEVAGIEFDADGRGVRLNLPSIACTPS